MNQKLTIVARIEAQPDQIELVKAELLKLIEPTLEEAGCIQYDLHQDVFSTICIRTMTTRQFFCFTKTGKIASSGKRI